MFRWQLAWWTMETNALGPIALWAILQAHTATDAGSSGGSIEPIETGSNAEWDRKNIIDTIDGTIDIMDGSLRKTPTKS